MLYVRSAVVMLISVIFTVSGHLAQDGLDLNAPQVDCPRPNANVELTVPNSSQVIDIRSNSSKSNVANPTLQSFPNSSQVIDVRSNSSKSNVANPTLQSFLKDNPNVAIVGNGALTLDEMNELRDRTKWGIVARFNDARNMKIDDFADVLFLREGREHNGFIHMNGGRARYEFIKTISKKNNAGHLPRVTVVSDDSDRISEYRIRDVILDDPFEHLHERGEVKWHGGSASIGTLGGFARFGSGWSTGLHAICFFSRTYPASKLHIFGMNWSARRVGHPFEEEKRIVEKEIPLTTVHPTANGEYLNMKHDDKMDHSGDDESMDDGLD